MLQRTGIFCAILFSLYCIIVFSSGCAQIGASTGGPRDSLPPVLIRANPEPNTVNFHGNRLSFTFDEYIDVQETQKNVLFSPLQKQNPTINYNLRTVTVKFRDTLLPNTTYTVNFGNAIRDVHESNIYRNFSYSFSTGPVIDSLGFRGRVLMAETGRADSNIVVLLYRNLSDTAVRTLRPDYITRLTGDGSFRFNHLAGGLYKAYALLDADGGKTYNSRSEAFGFADTTVDVTASTAPLVLYAYSEIKPDAANGSRAVAPATKVDKKLRFAATIPGTPQDLLRPLQLTFNHGLKVFDSIAVALTDTNFNRLPATVIIDSTRRIVSVNAKWTPADNYILLLPEAALQDSAGTNPFKSDTIRFKSKRTEDYGRLTFRFRGIDLSLHPVLQFVQSDQVLYSYPITATEWTNKQFPPGEYDIRILYDANSNGKWDPGNFSQRLQPEKAFTLPQKVSIRADWDNERDISF